MYRVFPYTRSCPHTPIISPHYLTPPRQNAYLLQLVNLRGHIIVPQSARFTPGFTLGVGHAPYFDKCMMTCLHRQSIIQIVSPPTNPQGSACSSLLSPTPWQPFIFLLFPSFCHFLFFFLLRVDFTSTTIRLSVSNDSQCIQSSPQTSFVWPSVFCF